MRTRLSALLRIVFFAGALFYLQWDLALVALFVAPLFWVAAKRFSRLIKHASREKRRRSGSLSAVAEESLSNQALVQASNRQDAELERFNRESEGIVQAELASTRIRGLFSPVVGLIELLGVMLVFVMGTIAVTDGRLTLGGLLVFVAYLTQLYGPVRDLSSLSNTIFKALAGAERVIELLDEEPRVVDQAGRQTARTRARGGRARRRHVRLPRCRRAGAARGHAACRPGRDDRAGGRERRRQVHVAKLLLRFYDPDQGAVRIDGNDLRDVQLASLRDNVSVLLQETLVLHGSVRENIAFGREDATEAEIVVGRPRRGRRTTSSRSCRTGTTPSSASAADACPAASASAWRSPERSWRTRPYSFSTSRPPGSTPPPRRR